ncbi:hypothetical protein [Intestinibacter bartlettii]|uniref:hypothetical protein n=1 Tax=Intestinibacter bartlettii TaxID=261299 RepID=UPI000820AD7F|nr:hypothetical protein [Intestinibacter bartlettii]SCI51602.1 Uncharacterised protein [uncultured Clostridium sp.]
MINKEKIKAKVKKAIKKLPSQAVVKRAYTNDFGEKSDLLELVCELEGLYHESNNQYSQNITLQNKAEVIKGKNIYFLIAYDETAKLIQKDDYIYINGYKYQIKDLGNVNKMDIYMDMRLQEVSYNE